MKNKELAQIFNNIADLLEINDENPFRIRAYRRAAFSLESLSQNLDTLVKEDRITEIAGIGKDLAEKVVTRATEAARKLAAEKEAAKARAEKQAKADALKKEEADDENVEKSEPADEEKESAVETAD